MTEIEPIFITIPLELAGERLDGALSAIIKTHSRAKIQEAIKNGALVDGKPLKPKDKVIGGEVVEIRLEVTNDPLKDAIAEDIPLDIVYEDDDIVVINKSSEMIVHPGAGNPSGTLMNGLLYRYPESRMLPRAGIVHRLDKNTSGIMVVAKTYEAYLSLCEQLATRDMGRIYHAVCYGVLIAGMTIDEPLGRHSKDRQKMAIQPMGKEAITHVRVIDRFREHTYIRCQLETGRTHQIRVHMAFMHFPLFGDEVYGGRLRIPKDLSAERIELLRNFKRQALHAKTLSLIHPKTREKMEFETPLPDDFVALITALKEDLLEHEKNDGY